MRITYVWKQRLIKAAWILIALALIIEVGRDCFRGGDFMGYVQAGELAIKHQDIYSDYLNTWPPFFSVFSIPVALADRLSSIGVRFIWLLGSLTVMLSIIDLTFRVYLKKRLLYSSTTRDGVGINFLNPVLLVPVLLVFRFVLDNLSNIQINIYILLLCVASLYYFSKGKFAASAFCLALGITLKVYPVFLLGYFIFKREFKIVGWTFGFILLLNSIAFLYFGFREALGFYKYWAFNVVSISPIANHKSQSFYGLVSRLLTSGYTESGLQINFLTLSAAKAKNIASLSILLLAIVPAWMFRKRLSDRQGVKARIEYAIVIGAIPLLSPLAWKAYFIFLWLPYFLTYLLLFRAGSSMGSGLMKKLKILFWVSVALTIFSTDGIVGLKAALFLETYSCITLGSVLLLIILFVFHRHSNLIESFYPGSSER